MVLAYGAVSAGSVEAVLVSRHGVDRIEFWASELLKDPRLNVEVETASIIWERENGREKKKNKIIINHLWTQISYSTPNLAHLPQNTMLLVLKRRKGEMGVLGRGGGGGVKHALRTGAASQPASHCKSPPLKKFCVCRWCHTQKVT